jgi:hypothetical protein
MLAVKIHSTSAVPRTRQDSGSGGQQFAGPGTNGLNCEDGCATGRKSIGIKHERGGCAVYNKTSQNGAAMAAEEPNENEIAKRTQTAKATNARLRLMKERNENYLAEQRDEK